MSVVKFHGVSCIGRVFLTEMLFNAPAEYHKEISYGESIVNECSSAAYLYLASQISISQENGGIKDSSRAAVVYHADDGRIETMNVT